MQLGVAPSRIAGDSCARTTWENATVTASWLRQHHPGAPVLLITDPWQLPRATRAFVRQGLQVHPLAAEPPLTAPERNRLALRKLAATVFIGCRDGCEGQRLLMQPCTRWAAGAYACTMIDC